MFIVGSVEQFRFYRAMLRRARYGMLLLDSVGSFNQGSYRQVMYDCRDSAVESSRVGGVNALVGSRDPVYNFLCC